MKFDEGEDILVFQDGRFIDVISSVKTRIAGSVVMVSSQRRTREKYGVEQKELSAILHGKHSGGIEVEGYAGKLDFYLRHAFESFLDKTNTPFPELKEPAKVKPKKRRKSKLEKEAEECGASLETLKLLLKSSRTR